MSCSGAVRLRRAVVADAPGIAAVDVRARQRTYEGHVSPAFLDCMRSTPREDSWREAIGIEAADRKPWVAIADARIVGVASGGIARDDGIDASTGEVYVLSVDQECWQRGIRTNLIEHVVRDLHTHGFARAVFWIVKADQPALQFAEHVGFHPDGASRHEQCGDTQVAQLRYVRPIS